MKIAAVAPDAAVGGYGKKRSAAFRHRTRQVPQNRAAKTAFTSSAIDTVLIFVFIFIASKDEKIVKYFKNS